MQSLCDSPRPEPRYEPSSQGVTALEPAPHQPYLLEPASFEACVESDAIAKSFEPDVSQPDAFHCGSFEERQPTVDTINAVDTLSTVVAWQSESGSFQAATR